MEIDLRHPRLLRRGLARGLVVVHGQRAERAEEPVLLRLPHLLLRPPERPRQERGRHDLPHRSLPETVPLQAVSITAYAFAANFIVGSAQRASAFFFQSSQGRLTVPATEASAWRASSGSR